MRACWLLALLLLASLLPMRAQAAVSCSASASILNFGSISTVPIPQTDVAPNNLSITCSGAGGSGATVCVGINAGTGTGSTVANRIMNSGANTMQYEIYSDASRTVVWGNTLGTDEPFFNVGNSTLTFPMYGRIPSQTKPPGTYKSTLTVTISYKNGNIGSCSGGGFNTASGGTFTSQVIINASCSISASNINFGSVANLTSVHNLSGSLSATCTTAAPYSIAMNAGSTTGNTIAARKLSLNGAGAGVVSYQLYRDSGPVNVWGDGTGGSVTYSGSGSGSAQTIPFYVQVPSQATPSPGTYKDTVTTTITF